MTYEEVLVDFEQQKSKHLTMSIVIDLLGMFTYAIPLLGELGDIIYAPIYGITIFSMYRLRVASAAFGGVAGFTEEILPGTDFIPTASVMWAYQYYFRRESTLKKFAKQKMKDQQVIQTLLDNHNQPKRPGLLSSLGTSIRNVFYEPPSSPYEDAAIDLDEFNRGAELPPEAPPALPRDEDYV